MSISGEINDMVMSIMPVGRSLSAGRIPHLLTLVICHSGMLLAGIQNLVVVDSRLKNAGMTLP
jgi:hypothetical protein